MNKVKQKELAENWDTVVEGQNFDRGKFLMSWINQGFSIDEICSAIEIHARHASSRGSVKAYIDKYGIAIGLDKGGAAAPLVLSNATLRKAVRAAGKEIEPKEDDEYVEYYEEQGATPAVAKRLAKAEKLGEWLKENDCWDEEKDRVKTKAIEKAEAKIEVTFDRWMSRFDRHWRNIDSFIEFLRTTPQDKMQDSTITAKLEKLAAQLEKQAERFETGHSKFEARQAAKNRKVTK